METTFQNTAETFMETPSPRQLNIYRETVKQAVLDKAPQYLSNAGLDYAAVMLATMFANAKDEMRLVVGELGGPVAENDEYVDALRSAIEKGVEAKVILLDKPNTTTKAFNLLKGYIAAGKPNVELRTATEETRDLLFSKMQSFDDNNPTHFSVVDNIAARIEANPYEHTAIGVFNDHPYLQKLTDIFTAAYNTTHKLS